MSWIESHQSLGGHPKKDHLAELLFNGSVPQDVADAAAIGILHRLWWWALDYAKDGDLSGYSDAVVAKGCGWHGDACLLVSSLIEARFIDEDRHIHDWDEYAGRLIERREQDAARKRTGRRAAASEPLRRTSSGRPADAPADVLRDGARTYLPTYLKPISSSADADEGHSAVDKSGPAVDKSIDATAAIADDGFTDFWAVYPRKVGKAEAERRWTKMSARSRKAAVDAACHLARYVSSTGSELRYVPHPATFIGPKRIYEDWAHGPPAGYEAPAAASKREACPECETDLTYDDERRPHCPLCGWRPS